MDDNILQISVFKFIQELGGLRALDFEQVNDSDYLCLLKSQMI